MALVADAYHLEHNTQPSGRLVIAPEQNAPVVVYLLSELAAGITGQVIRIQGDALNLMTHPAARQPGH